MKTSASERRSLPPLQLEDHIALLQALVIAGWVAAFGTIHTEIWARSSPAVEWPTLGGFPETYRALSIEFFITIAVLTVLLIKRDWYEAVPRQSADRVKYLLVAVIGWLGIHLGIAFYMTGGLASPVLPLIPLVVLASLASLPGPAGWWTASYLFAMPALTIVLERANLLQSPGPLAEIFAYTGEVSTPMGLGTLLFVFLAALLLAGVHRKRADTLGRSLAGATALDATTGLFHRDFLTKRLEGQLKREARFGGANSALLLVGISGISDETADPRAADEQLRRTAQHLLEGIRIYSDTPTRYGLTTLAVLLPTSTHEGVHAVVSRIQDSFVKNEPGLQVRFGAALMNEPAKLTAIEVMEAAERALGSAAPNQSVVVMDAGI